MVYGIWYMVYGIVLYAQPYDNANMVATTMAFPWYVLVTGINQNV